AAPLYTPAPVPVPVIVQTPVLGSTSPAVPQMRCAPGAGSSINNNASDQEPASCLLVTVVLRDIRISTDGTGEPAAVGTPPVQVIRKSRVSSASPSARSVFATLLVTQLIAGCARADSPPIRKIAVAIRIIRVAKVSVMKARLAVYPAVQPIDAKRIPRINR